MAARALEPAPEHPGGRGGEEFVHALLYRAPLRGAREDQKSISSV